MLSDEEILRRLRAIRFSPTHLRNARKAPSMNGLATKVGLTREWLFRLTSGAPIGPETRSKLSAAFTSDGD
jgi:hypothetical protein